MLVFFGILIIIACILLGIVVLIQNPKGGGVTGSLGGFSNQLIGVKQTTDVLEKSTWLFAGIVALLCVISPAFIPSDSSKSSINDDLLRNAPVSTPAATPAVPSNSTTLPAPAADTNR